MTYTRVLRAENGSECLVTIWPDGSVSIARRPNAHSTWGPPEMFETVREETEA